jgi:MFS family permease
MSDPYHKGLERNITLYYIFKIFAKRVYLPLIAIYLVNDAKLTIANLAWIATITTITQLFLDVPTGYAADKWGHKKSMAVGMFSASLAPLSYLFFPNFAGALAASILFFAGFSFVSGAAQAFIHDTLRALSRAHEYTKLMGRAQGYGLLGNVVLVAIVPLTWRINHQLPFIIGFICTFIGFILVLLMVTPKEEEHADKEKDHISLLATLRVIPLADLLFLLMMYGIASTVFDVAPQYRELIFAHLGIPVVYFGFILSAGSVVAALAGRYIHLLAKLKPHVFYFFDTLLMTAVMIAIGLVTNPILSVLVFLIIPAYDRNRSIIAESHILAKYPDHTRKATLLSVLDFYPRINGIWIPLALSYAMKVSGIQRGYATFGIVLLPVLLLFYLGYRLTTKEST